MPEVPIIEPPTQTVRQDLRAALPVNYNDVPAVLKWVVAMCLHLDNCIDALYTQRHDNQVRLNMLRLQIGGLFAVPGAIYALAKVAQAIGLV